MMNGRRFFPVAFFAIFVLTMVTCSSIDCPYINTVYTTYQLKQGEEKTDTLKDTLFVWIHRFDMTDSVVLNRAVNITSFALPISYTSPADSLFFCRIRSEADKTQSVPPIMFDTMVVAKTNTPHFESVECSPKYFHEITDVSYTHNGIDSIKITNSSVNYDPKDHFNIYFKH